MSLLSAHKFSKLYRSSLLAVPSKEIKDLFSSSIYLLAT